MVQANELRLDNWIDVIGGERQQVSQLRKQYVKDGGFLLINSSLPEHCLSIPLTPQILEKAGFKKCSCGGYKSDLLHIGQDDKDRLYYKGVTITSLHQLQNLYFSLTGKELQVNLK